MSYIGIQTQNQISPQFSREVINGDGSATSFTLIQDVPGFNADNIMVVVNNVIQEPVAAYTIKEDANGNPRVLDFGTGNVLSTTDECYVQHRGVGTLNMTPAAGSVNAAALQDNLRSGNVDSFTVTTAGQTAFTLSETPLNAQSISVFVNGIYQKPTTNFTVSGTTLTLTAGAVVGDEIDVIHHTIRTTVTHVADGSVTSGKLDTNIQVAGTLGVTGNVTASADLSVAGNLTVSGTTTTIDTTVESVDKLEVGANSSDYGAKINQAGSGNILQLQDGGVDKVVVADGGNTTFSGNIIATANIQVDDIVEKTSAHGVEIEGVTLKDGALNKVTETSGVLKQNLLTNSGFEVWSQSTLENVGSDLMGGLTDNSSYPWETRPGSGGPTGSWNNTSGWGLAYKAVSLTEGKLYRITATGSNLSGVTTQIGTGSNIVASNYTNKLNIVNGTATSVFEATSTTTYIIMQTASASASAFTLSEFTLYEVTPGCVASDTKAMDGWFKDAGLDLRRQHNDGGTYTKDGSFYSLKFTPSNSDGYVAWPNGYSANAHHYQKYAGRTLTGGAWVKTSTANHVRVGLYDGSSYSYTSYHTGGGGWEWLEVTATMQANPTAFHYRFRLSQSSGDVYISQPMLVFGNSIGEGNYTRPQGEVIYFENPLVVSNELNNKSSLSTSGEVDLFLAADSSGCLPKGAKAVMTTIRLKDSGSAGASSEIILGAAGANLTNHIIFSAMGLVNDLTAYGNLTVPCNSDGNIRYKINASGSGTLDLPLFRYTGVELH